MDVKDGEEVLELASRIRGNEATNPEKIAVSFMVEDIEKALKTSDPPAYCVGRRLYRRYCNVLRKHNP